MDNLELVHRQLARAAGYARESRRLAEIAEAELTRAGLTLAAHLTNRDVLGEEAAVELNRNLWLAVGEEAYVWDPNEERSWGPFQTEREAAAFVTSDKYLESWCLVKNRPWPVPQWRPDGTVVERNYPPSEYHGRWPL